LHFSGFSFYLARHSAKEFFGSHSQFFGRVIVIRDLDFKIPLSSVYVLSIITGTGTDRHEDTVQGIES
jgi:hypothetical protein